MSARRVFVDRDPFLHTFASSPWERGRWPAKWVHLEGVRPPFASAFRRRFRTDGRQTVRMHVSADERYELFLDGERIGRGSERGDAALWFFESYELELEPGEHTLVARVWAIGKEALLAQYSIEPGFVLAAEGEHGELLSTGKASWEVKRLGGYEFSKPGHYFGTCATTTIRGADCAWGFERGEGDGWQPARSGEAAVSAGMAIDFAHTPALAPATLPPMLEVVRQVGQARFASANEALTPSSRVLESAHDPALARAYDALLAGSASHVVPAGATERVIVDLGDYYCAFPELVTSGGRGARIATRWAESLFEQPQEGPKGQRDAVYDKYFIGWGETFLPEGGQSRTYGPLWWQAGRFLELCVEAGPEPLVLEALRLRETRYPLERESTFTFADRRLERPIPIMMRALQMCSHETYFDCPYYEQLMYVGDTRLEVLATYAVTSDSRLPRKAVRLFDASRVASGFTYSRYPSHVMQIIPPFSLWWVCMLYDFALYRGEREFVRERLLGSRAVLDAFLALRREDGLIQSPEFWNFVDWVPSWRNGVPPGAEPGSVSGVIQWQALLALTYASELERWVGEAELADRYARHARSLYAAVRAKLWHEGRGLFAENLEQTLFSEHSQALAIVSELLAADERHALARKLSAISQQSAADDSIARTTIYFSHYLLDAFARTGQAEALFARLSLWFELEGRGFKTTFEAPGDTRSDCHAWGAHPLHHYYASILGVRPAAFGFERVRIEPNLGALASASGKLVHPLGTIELEYERRAGGLHVRYALPRSLSGELVWQGLTSEISGSGELAL